MTFRYAWSDLRKDAIAGLTVAAISLPQAMAYALIAGVDPRYGLYSAIVVTAVASVFGSSAHLINGPTNAISLVVFSALAFLDPNRPDQLLPAMCLLGIMVGLIQTGVAVFKLGDLTRYISESVVIGFMAGAGLLVSLSQVGNLFGLHDRGTGHQHLLYRLWLIVTEGGPVNLRAVVIGLGTVVVVLVLRRVARKYRLPRADMLVTLIAAAVVAWALGWSEADKPLLAVVGTVPPDLPLPRVPTIELGWVREMSGSAVAIAFLGLLEALAISKSIANRTRQPLNYNRQCLAEGLANLVGGFFQCLPGSGSLTRSAINFQAGAVTRLSGVVAAAAVAVVVVMLAPYARYIPKASLAGLLLVTAAGLMDWQRLFYAMRASRFDAGLVLVTAFAAVFISVEFSILIGVGLSVALFVPRAARLQSAELIVGSDGVLRDRLPTDPPCSALVVFDLEGELFFGAAPDLERCFEQLKMRVKGGARVLVLRVKRTRNPDMVCMERLQHFLQEMDKQGVTVLLCAVREDFDLAMQNLHFGDWLPTDRVFREDRTGQGSATLAAVRRAYELLGPDVCANCPRRGRNGSEESTLYYMI